MGSYDEAALIAEIRAAPDDDAPRLVFADALSDRGDPWGELIVAACELARLDREGTVDAERRRTLEERCRAIRQQRWRERSMRCTAVIERGFCSSVELAQDETRHVAGYEFALLRELTLWISRIGLAALASWPLLGQLERLVLRGTQRTRGYRPYWLAPTEYEARAVAFEQIAERARLSSLELNDVDLREDEVAGLVRSPLRASLRRIAIIRWRGLGETVEHDWPELEALELIELDLTGDALARALRPPGLDGLALLDVSGNSLGEVGMQAILGRALSKLRALHIERTQMGPQAMMALARSVLVRRLTSLSIGENYANPTARALCSLAEAAEQLRDLAIDQRSLRSEDAVEIVRAVRAPLHALRLRIGDRGLAMVAALLDNPALRGLRKLDLSGQMLGHAAAVALSSAELPSLEWLDLSNCQLDPESAYALARSSTLPRRLALRLQGNASGPSTVTEPLLERFHDVRY